MELKNYPPTAAEIRSYLEGHTRNQVAEMVNVQPRTVSYWRSGKVEMPYSIWFTLRAKIDGEIPDG